MFLEIIHLRHPPPKEPVPPKEPLLPPYEPDLPPEKPCDLPAEWHELHVLPTAGAADLVLPPEGAVNVLFCDGALPSPPVPEN